MFQKWCCRVCKAKQNKEYCCNQDYLSQISSECSCPIIACGGVGEWEHFKEALDKTNVDSVAAANIFQYTDQSVYMAKKYLSNNGCNVRKPDLLKI